MREKASGLDMRFSYNSVGNPVSILYNNVEYYYVKNLQGDIIGLIDAAGTWVVEYSYDVWGNIRSVFGSMASTLGQDNPIRYRGYYYDAETKLYYVSSRYFCPELCRFINPDNGISGVGGDTRGCNLFSYCLNNPVNMSDPGGNWPKWISNIGNVVKWVVNTAVSQAKSAVLSNTTVVYNGLPRTILMAHQSRNVGMDQMVMQREIVIITIQEMFRFRMTMCGRMEKGGRNTYHLRQSLNLV